MCGIVGYWDVAGGGSALKAALPGAVATLRHRGPDGHGVWYSSTVGVGLGHARLAIIDLTEAGAQPMVAGDAEIAIVFNGEIYNHAEIAADLRARGHRLVGHSDTEVILAAFREWGPACVERFIGMFAFAIWDGSSRRLSLCRDRVGVKPLYYGWDGKVLCFASELKALRALPHWQAEVDKAALGEMLQYGYIGAPRTIYRSMRKLPPGCWLHLSVGGEPRLETYWSLQEIARRGPLKRTDRQLEDELESLLLDAFRYRLVADVPVGLFLSGGIDSSLVAGLLKSAGVALDTFTIGFRSAAHDESGAARDVATALGLSNRALIIDGGEAWPILKEWPDLYDEPFGDHSGIPTYLVARMAREQVKVALSADGGDELFCGYAGYEAAAARMAGRDRLSSGLRATLASGVRTFGTIAAPNIGSHVSRRVHRALGSGLALDRVQKAAGYLGAECSIDAMRPFQSFWQPDDIGRLLGVAYRDPRQGTLMPSGNAMEQLAAVDFHEFLADDVLAKADRATMAVGLEVREPLLDHRIVEMAFRMPLHLRHGALGNKHILRSILYRHVPRALVDRKKQGFSVPIADWTQRLMDEGGVRESAEILATKIGVDKRYLDGAMTAFAGSASGKNRLWLIYVAGQWAKRWM